MKDLIEEQLFDRPRDLFTDLSLVFMDTGNRAPKWICGAVGVLDETGKVFSDVVEGFECRRIDGCDL